MTDMIAADQVAARALLAEYKQTTATTVAEGLEIEGHLFRSWHKTFDPSQVAARRQAIASTGFFNCTSNSTDRKTDSSLIDELG